MPAHRFRDLHADDIVVHGPSGDSQGAEAVMEEEFTTFEVFSDLTWTLDSVVAEDDMVAVRLTGSGTHDGPMGDLAPTGPR